MKHVLLSLSGTGDEKESCAGYTVFEDNQVLTAGQLNGVTRYLDEENRKTRVSLLGVGIVCGLRVSLEVGEVVLTRGAGVTSQGDVVCIPEDVTYSHYIPYPETAPRYGPFFQGETRIPLYELVPNGVEDSRAAPLRGFGSVLGTLAAVLFVESYEKDEDLCSGTDCDNLGRCAVHNVKVLLTDEASAARLTGTLSTISRQARSLPELVAGRPAITTVGSLKPLAAIYRTSCNTIHQHLVSALQAMYAATFLRDLLPPEPVAWNEKLDRIKELFASRDPGIQYYHDFLKDMVETWNAFRGLLLGIDGVCCPDVAAFPKHLVLGPLAPGRAETRTGFHPSPLVGGSAEKWDHARFLGRKLLAMIDHFRLPEGANLPIRITPGFGEDRSLEERPIPFYYDAVALHPSWSWELASRGMSKHCYSYHAPDYGAEGGAARPLETQAGRFPFLRIEGQVGAPVVAVKSKIESEIRNRNLSFSVRAVLVVADKTKIAVQPPLDYSDLHRFHYLLRQDLAYQLDDAQHFGSRVKEQVYAAVDSARVPSSPESGTKAYKEIAEEKSKALTTAAKASGKFDTGYKAYRQDEGWTIEVQNALTASGELKYDLGDILKTEYPTPVDTLIGGSRPHWLPWLDQIIDQKEETQKDKLLFNNFLAEHPGLEHFAGVVRGGTFILVYDAGGRVVADFMLPYRCCDPVEAPPSEPRLPKPQARPDRILESGLNIQTPRKKFVSDLVNEGILTFEKAIEPRFKAQDEVLDVFERSFAFAGEIYGRQTTPPGPDLGDWQDRLLELLIQEAQVQVRKIRHWLERNKEERVFDAQQKTAEQELARTIEETARYVAESRMEVSPGSEGYRAMVAATEHALRLADEEVVASLKERLSGIEAAPALRKLINAMLRRK